MNTKENAEKVVVTLEETDKALTIVGKIDNWEDFFMDEKNFKPVLEAVKKRAKGLVADPTTKEGQTEIKTLVKKLNGLVKDIDLAHDNVVKELKAKPKRIDNVRKYVKDNILLYKEELLKPIKEIEERQEQILAIDNMPATEGIGCDSYSLKVLLERLDEYEKKDWKESKEQAQDSINEARRVLKDMLARAEKDEAEKRELEELRKQKAEMEQAAREKAEAELKKAQAEAEKAKAEAEQARRQAEQAEAEKAEAIKAQAEAEAKVPDWKKNEKPQEERLFPEDERERKRRYNREALKALVPIVKDEETAKAIITAIAKEAVPHIHIDYT